MRLWNRAGIALVALGAIAPAWPGANPVAAPTPQDVAPGVWLVPGDECATAWTDSIRTLLADDPREQQRARGMAAYYVDVLRANGGRSKFCAAAR